MLRLVALVLIAVPALAEGPVMGEHVEVELIAERTGIQPGSAITVGLRMGLERDWHTYWKNPGDAGQEPAIAWELPPGFRAGPI